MNNKYEILIFDLDDTLIDNLENVKYAFKKMTEYLKKDYSEEDFKKWYLFDKQFWIDFYNNKISLPCEKENPKYVSYVQSLRYKLFYNDEFSMDKALEINEIFLQSLKEVVYPIDGAKSTLEYLSKKYTLVVATNGPKQAVETKLKKIDCLKYIKYIFSADMTSNKVTKPNKLYFDELLEYLNYFEKDRILLIGDSLRTEVKGGLNSGIDSCWFNKNNEQLPKEYKPQMIITNLNQLTKEL